MRLLLPLFILLSASLPLAHSQEPAVSSANPRENVDVGGRNLIIPAPAGFDRTDGLNPEVDKAVEAMLGATNRYLARFEPQPANTAAAGRSFNAQVMRSVEAKLISEAAFVREKGQAKAEFDKMQENMRQQLERINDAQRKAQDTTGADVALSISDMAVLGYFDDSPTCLGYTMAVNASVQGPQGVTKVKGVVAGMMVPVNGRLIFLNANADFNSPADRQWAEQAVMAWRDAVVAVNPRVKTPFDQWLKYTDVARSAGFGALIGGCVGLVLMVLKKIRG